jgi:hypothetical protein
MQSFKDKMIRTWLHFIVIAVEPRFLVRLQLQKSALLCRVILIVLAAIHIHRANRTITFTVAMLLSFSFWVWAKQGLRALL